MAGIVGATLLKVETFITEDGKPTCSLDICQGHFCRFLGTKRFGTEDCCIIGDVTVIRDEDGIGFIRPHANCLVWSKQ